MRCPTCGRAVRKRQNTCAYCGALVGAEVPVKEIAGAGPPMPASTEPARNFDRWEMHPRGPVFEPRPEEPAKLDDLPPHREEGAPAESGEPAPRRSPPLLRTLLLLVFVLFPLLRSFIQNVFLNRQAKLPVLREVVLCEGVAEGEPQGPKTTFSLRNDRRVVLYTQWTGTRARHAIAFQWLRPDGAIFEVPIGSVRFQDDAEGFFIASILPLGEEMPLGQWKAEVLLDGKVHGSGKFQLRE